MKRIYKWLVVIVLLLGVGAGAAIVLNDYEPYNLVSIQNNPAAQLQKSLEKTETALNEGAAVPMSETIKQALTGGVVDLEFETEDDMKLTSSLYLREDSFAMLGDATMTEEDPIHYGLWVSEEAIALELPAVLGASSYGFSPKTLEDDLKNTALLDMLGISYEDAAELLDTVLAWTPKNAKKENSDWKTLLAAKQQLEDLVKSCTTTVTEGQYTTVAGHVDVYYVTYTLTPNQMGEALDIAATWLLESESYKNSAEDEKAMTEEIKAKVKEAKNALKDSNATTILEFCLHAKTQVIVQANCRIDWLIEEESCNFTASLNLGDDPVQSVLYSAGFELNLPGQPTEKFLIEYHRSHAHNLPGRTLVVETPDETITLMDLQYNTLNGEFEVTLMDREYSFSGVYKEEKEKLTLQLNFEEVGTLTVIFKSSATMLDVPKYKNICTMTAEELTELMAFVLEAPEPDCEPEKEADIIITGDDGSTFCSYIMHDYSTVGDLLIGESIAILDDGGRILSLCDEDFSGNNWTVCIDDVLTEGNLNLIPLKDYTSISISAYTEDDT